MEKILLVLNAHRPNTKLIDFACKIASVAETRLTGLFIENQFYEHITEGTVIKTPYFYTVNENMPDAIVNTDTDQAISIFKQECIFKGVSSDVLIDKGEPLKQVIFESRFADLLIIDPEIDFFEREEELPSDFLKEVLTNAECPVLVAPGEFDHVEEVVFCYDGSASAVFAIKQFTYLFPELKYKKVLLLEVNTTGASQFDDSDRRMMDWLRNHYRSVYYHVLKGLANDELYSYFFLKKDRIIVMGAYGRSLLSNFLKKSKADMLIRMVDLPLFITHY